MTNPNPVAPKTDTPATQIPEQLPEHQARVSRDSTLGSHMCSCGFGYPGVSYEEWMRHYVRELESTLAAERASRLRAEEALRGMLNLWTSGRMSGPESDAAQAYFAKPSASPEQAEEAK